MNIEKMASNTRTSEKGNVLFLILIAVALFAALSYAVTQSTRSGGGDASKETNLVNAAGLTQYPASIKTSITRMLVSSGVTADDLLFDLPPFTDLTTTTLQARGVFYPGTTSGGGGGATYNPAPANVMANNSPGTWYFNGENQVVNIGTGGALSASNADVIAFLPGVSLSVCQSIHQRLGLSTTIIDLSASALLISTNMDFTDQNIDAGGATITGANLDGQPQGCFISNAGPPAVYTYYHVIVER